MKTLHGLMCTDVDGRTNVRAVERLASWASRYSMLFFVVETGTVSIISRYSRQGVRASAI